MFMKWSAVEGEKCYISILHLYYKNSELNGSWNSSKLCITWNKLDSKNRAALNWNSLNIGGFVWRTKKFVKESTNNGTIFIVNIQSPWANAITKLMRISIFILLT